MPFVGRITGLNTRRGALLFGAWPLVLAGSAATPAAAQRDTVVVRTVSSWQRDVDRLTRELVEQRRIEGEFLRMLSALQARQRESASDSLRTGFFAQSQLVAQRLRETSVAQLRLRRNLETMCSSVPKPEGWLGVATTGFTVYDRQNGGPQVVRFMEQPVVESVDPGSPADRVGLRTGDILLEIGGQPLLHRDVVFAELLRPGERIAVKARRGGEIVTLMPLIEPLPTALTRTPCSWVDASTAYVLAAPPGTPSYDVEVIGTADAPEQKVVYTGSRVRLRRDSATTAAARPTTTVFAGPMTRFFTRGVNPVAGVQFVPVNPDLARTFGVEHGLFVIDVLPGTPGREAGLRGGDVLLSADEVELRSAFTLQRVIGQAEKRAVTLIVIRDKKREKITLRW
ncbi:MAG TPA: PDZ domain-containing protein [Gemmatimonadaceae bacterium]